MAKSAVEKMLKRAVDKQYAGSKTPKELKTAVEAALRKAGDPVASPEIQALSAQPEAVGGGMEALKQRVSAGEGMGTRLAKKVGPYAPGLLLFAAIQKMLNLPTEIGESRLQREALQSQGRSVTPESLYYQAALPQAQEEEAQARQSLMSHLSGGVIGPSLARGERLIGGR